MAAFASLGSRPRGAKGPPLISRDLTVAWRKARDSRSAEQRADNSKLSTDPLLAHDPEAALARTAKGSSLPPVWVDTSEQARDEIRKLREKVVLLTKAQQRRLLKVMDSGVGPDAEVERLSNDIAQAMSSCQRAIQQVGIVGAGESSNNGDAISRQNVQRGLAGELQSVSKDCRQAQRQYLDEIRRVSASAIPSSSAGEGAASREGPRDAGFSQMQMQEVEDMESVAMQRNAEVTQIASSINDLNVMFRELAVMVVEQGTVLDRIDCNVEKVQERAGKANKQMQKAHKHKKETDQRAFKCFLFWIVADVLLFLIWLVKLKIKYGLSWEASFMVICIIFGMIAGCVLACRHKKQQMGERYTKMVDSVPSVKQVFPLCDPQLLRQKLFPGPLGAAKAGAQAASVAGVPGGGLGQFGR